MWHRTMMLAVLLLGLANSVKGGHEGRTCLDEAIPENQRSNITIGGVSMPPAFAGKPVERKVWWWKSNF